MEEKQTGLDNEVLIEIIHGIKDIIIELIDRAFPQGQKQIGEYEEVYK